MSNGAGIQELMAAETRASQIVAEARIGKRMIRRRRRHRKKERKMTTENDVAAFCKTVLSIIFFFIQHFSIFSIYFFSTIFDHRRSW